MCEKGREKLRVVVLTGKFCLPEFADSDSCAFLTCTLPSQSSILGGSEVFMC